MHCSISLLTPADRSSQSPDFLSAAAVQSFGPVSVSKTPAQPNFANATAPNPPKPEAWEDDEEDADEEFLDDDDDLDLGDEEDDDFLDDDDDEEVEEGEPDLLEEE